MSASCVRMGTCAFVCITISPQIPDELLHAKGVLVLALSHNRLAESIL